MGKIHFATTLPLLLFIGCSSTYQVTDFPSKEKFYEEFNNNFKDREVKVTLVNDSSFIAQNGVEINHDTLLSFVNLEEKKNRQFALSEVADIDFQGSTATYASVLLKNGDKLAGDKVKVTKDSISFVESKSLLVMNKLVPTDKLKTIGYTPRLKSIAKMGVFGLFTGGLLGYLIGAASIQQSQSGVNPIKNDKHDESEDFFGALFGGSVGLLTGAIVGYFWGFPVIYEFNK